MLDRDLIKFKKTLTGIGELYDKIISETLIELYWQALKCFKLQEVNQAVADHIHNPDQGKYFPKPADLVKLIKNSGTTKALQAWTTVEQAIRQTGAYQSVVFDDPVIHVVIYDMGGWIKLCTTPSNEIQIRANEFKKRYTIFVDQSPKHYPKYCCGLIETLNIKNGYTIKSWLFFEDPKKDKLMFKISDTPLVVHYSDIFVVKKSINKLNIKN
jgi:hypothetical protein